jgi:hypothetical protein
MRPDGDVTAKPKFTNSEKVSKRFTLQRLDLQALRSFALNELGRADGLAKNIKKPHAGSIEAVGRFKDVYVQLGVPAKAIEPAQALLQRSRAVRNVIQDKIGNFGQCDTLRHGRSGRSQDSSFVFEPIQSALALFGDLVSMENMASLTATLDFRSDIEKRSQVLGENTDPRSRALRCVDARQKSDKPRQFRIATRSFQGIERARCYFLCLLCLVKIHRALGSIRQLFFLWGFEPGTGFWIP